MLSDLKPFYDEFICNKLEFPAGQKDWCCTNYFFFCFDDNTVEYIDNLEIRQDNNSRNNSEIKKQTIRLIITTDETSHYLVVALLPILFKDI